MYLTSISFSFSYKKLILLIVTIATILGGSSSYARELNSGNIATYCSTWDTSCEIPIDIGITSIASNTFIGYSSLISLSLYGEPMYGNNITSIESGDFAGLDALTYLNLQGNHITSIESGDFAGLTNLQNLHIGGYYDGDGGVILSTLTSIESGSFAVLTNLQVLNLQGNEISIIERGTFDGLTSLSQLTLDGNQITSIESGSFAGLTSLTSLSLGGMQSRNGSRFNQITSIESVSLAVLTNLQVLNLQGNEISTIERGTFDGLTNLSNLVLSSNQITSIESGDFSGLDSLTYLELYGNQITSIENGAFDGLTSLTSLGLGGNQITSIESGDFSGLTSLTYLDLYGNQIISIENGAFDGLTSLQDLYLWANCLNNEDTVLTNYLDGLGISNIDYGSQLICLAIEYTPDTSTTGSVTGSLIFKGPTSKINTLTAENPSLSSYNYVFTGNGSYLFDYSNIVDNNNNTLWKTNFGGSKIITGTVTWIDTTSPIGTITYSTTGITNQSVIATLTLSETGIVNNNSGSVSYIFSGNGDFLFEYQDIAGNTGATTASVTWIDTIAPTITLNGSGTFSGYVGDSYTDAGASWTDAVAGSGTLIGSGTVNTSLTGTYTITYTVTDTAGNTSTATRTVTILPVVVVPPFIVPPSGGGGSVGGGGSPITLIPTVTKTPAIGPINQTGIITTQTGTRTDLPSTPTPITTIIQQKAYEWALSKGITTVATVSQARLDKNITRAELAKMLSVYATDVLEKEPVQSDIACDFTDTNQANKDLLPYITQVCELGIMGVQSDGKTPLTKFNPNSLVTRAEFGTVLSRVLYGTTNNTSSPQWREGHLNNLRKSNIISVVNPNLQEQRGWIMTMLYRTVQK